MADVTALIAEENIAHEFQSAIEQRVYEIDLADPALSGILATGTHNIVDLAAGECLLKGAMIITTSFTSTDAGATVKWSLGDDLCGLLTADGTEMAKGDVIVFGETDLDAVAGVATYRAAADTLDMVVATKALLTGKFLLVLDIVNVDELSGQSL